jgi:hypothetical protein
MMSRSFPSHAQRCRPSRSSIIVDLDSQLRPTIGLKFAERAASVCRALLQAVMPPEDGLRATRSVSRRELDEATRRVARTEGVRPGVVDPEGSLLCVRPILNAQVTRMTRKTRMARPRFLAALLVVAITAGFSARPADAAFSGNARKAHATTRFNDCWASPETPIHSGSTVQSQLTWQCNGLPDKMQIYVTLTSAYNGTKYSASATCFNTNVCSTPISGPWVSGGYSDDWTLRAEYVYVVTSSGSHYEFGPAWTWHLT